MPHIQMTGYSPIEDYGLIGDMHTCALVSRGGSIDSMCWPVFDSPSIFCRLLDKDKGGYYSISPAPGVKALNKQKYLPYINMLETKWINETGVVNVLDYFPVSSRKPSPRTEHFLSGRCCCSSRREDLQANPTRHSGLIRKIGCVRGTMDIVIEIFPAFNYARDDHRATDCPKDDIGNARTQTMTFDSPTERLLVDVHVEPEDKESNTFPTVQFELQEKPHLKGPGLVARLKLSVGQAVTFILRSDETNIPHENVGAYIERLESETFEFWTAWTRQCTFRGHYREQVERSLLVLKLLTYKPTGAIVAAPTFSLPEDIGGSRNWDYRYSWVRDTAFTLYVFLKNGYSEEAEAYIRFIFDCMIPAMSERAVEEGKEQLLPIMLTIRGEHQIPEFILEHLEGYRGSRPVRIGNDAATHVQLDTYGALLDSIYLYNKHAGPISYDQWLGIRGIINHVITLRNEPDMSIWEVRGKKQNFVYTKIMLWVTLDRAIRLTEKRSHLPCKERADWIATRDEIYEDIMTKGYNMEGGFFCMSYESRDLLDAAVLIAPLVLFIAPDDPRFISTLNKIMQAPEKGGLTSAKMVYRYDPTQGHDGIGGREGAFIMVTFWLIESMSRASTSRAHIENHPHLQELHKAASTYFDNVLSFANHVGIFSEEVDISGEQIGNTPQAFSHLACISAAMNLAR
ncbi:hypothetical protein AJ80_09477 [Polytolypa hystricis UAMH7299]|uniref:Uncharacterized protein n=1 Tax=Polytolypa hystricis (strain UAMH7299) TaxID=1447883 RepID=A0A2B7WHH4_POLH7|nr:hypothetical protein AJ80_09477 [Polytolypa hystricis UAMH7299]